MASLAQENNDGDASLQYIGVDLSYSVNKKSYNMINASKLDEFLKSQNINDGVKCVTELVSFGDDRYGFKSSSTTSGTALTGFTFEKGEFHPLLELTQNALDSVSSSSSDLILSNTASGQEAVIFNNATSQFKTIDLFDKKFKNAKTFSSSEDDLSGDHDDDGDDDNEKEEETKANGDTEPKANGGKKDEADGAEKEDGAEKSDKNDGDNGSTKNGKKESGSNSNSKTKRKTSSSSEPKFKVKSSIKRVFKHLLLTANGSLYGLQKSFHKKYFGSKKVVEVKCDGSRCALCLDENGVLWSFGINMFGKLGLKRNDKKQIYTNPREIALFKAYKVRDFGITNRCCVAVCANGNVYGWGSYSKTMDGTDGDIWYTPQLISKYTDSAKKRRWRVWCGFRFMMFLDEGSNELFVANTEFGFTVRDEAKHGLLIETQTIKVPENVKVSEVIPSSESAIIVVQ